MFDRRIAELKRIVEADPKDKEAQLALFHAELRFHDSSYFYEPLKDWRLWQNTFPVVQDFILQAFQFKRLHYWRCRVFKCKNIDLCSVCVGLNPDCSHCKGIGTEERIVSFRLPVYYYPSIDAQFVLVPGDPEKDIKPFLAARWPITQRQYARSIGEVASSGRSRRYSWRGRGPGPNIPSSFEVFKGALKWTKKFKLRLPSVKEWKYLASATTDTTFYWGNDFDYDYAWVRKNNYDYCPKQSLKLHEKEKKWNAFGLVDIIGNTWEWTNSENPQIALGSSSGNRTPSNIHLVAPLRGHNRVPGESIGIRPVMDINCE